MDKQLLSKKLTAEPNRVEALPADPLETADIFGMRSDEAVAVSLRNMTLQQALSWVDTGSIRQNGPSNGSQADEYEKFLHMFLHCYGSVGFWVRRPPFTILGIDL